MKRKIIEKLDFGSISGKSVSVDFEGGDITSDAGLSLLAEADEVLGLTRSMAGELEEWRDAERVLHDLDEMMRQRVFGIGAGYADCNDHNSLRRDPALKMACDKAPQGEGELASQPTLSRFENQPRARTLIGLAVAQGRRMIELLPAGTRRVTLDVDATDDKAYGDQQLVMFNGYYGHHCYCPLFLHMTPEDGRQRLLGGLLRAGNAGATIGLPFMVRQAVRELRRRFPDIEITLRGDAAFGCEKVLRMCHQLGINYILGLKSNACLSRWSEPMQVRAAVRSHFVDNRVFDEIDYRAQSWGQAEHVIVKSQAQGDRVHTRYLVSKLPEEWGEDSAQKKYQFYCGRGEQENRIKELKLDLDSGRTSCSSYLANQFRLSLHVAACMLWSVVQQGLAVVAAGSEWANFQIGSLRERLLKVGARVVQSSRRIVVHVASSYPHAALWSRLHAHLNPAPS